MEDALLPPPRRPEATPLSNADFRRFLDTPRRDVPGPSLGQQQRQQAAKATAADQAGQKPKKPYRPRRKPEADVKDEDEELYRHELSCFLTDTTTSTCEATTRNIRLGPFLQYAGPLLQRALALRCLLSVRNLQRPR